MIVDEAHDCTDLLLLIPEGQAKPYDATHDLRVLSHQKGSAIEAMCTKLIILRNRHNLQGAEIGVIQRFGHRCTDAAL
jgi:hypothetical protein